MKVYIGPYRDWIGPYQLADLLQHVGVSEDKCHEIGRWLSKTWVDTACNWVHSKKKRKIKVRIDGYDIWSMDHTLGMIILPMLKLIRADNHGAGMIADDDVPEELKSTSAPPREHEHDTDDFVFDRWNYALDQMIFSFESTQDDNVWEDKYFVNGFDREGYMAQQAIIANGFRLFGKYFQALWT
jgi:hypothetical protein